MVFGKLNQILANLCFHEALRRNSGHYVQAARIGKSGVPLRRFIDGAAFLEAFRYPDDRAVAVADRVRSKNDGKAVAVLVKDGNIQDRWFSVTKGEIYGIVRIGIEVIQCVAGGQQMVAKKMPDDILSQVSRDLFGAFIPKADAPVAVHKIDAGFQAIQNGLKIAGSFNSGIGRLRNESSVKTETSLVDFQHLFRVAPPVHFDFSAGSSQRRKPPVNAAELSPKRHPGGKVFSSFAFPPPRTT